MRIIARSTLKAFWIKHADAEQPIKAWFKFVSSANWNSPQDLKRDYRTASFLKQERVCFNIAGNKYRLIVRINYHYKIIYIRFIGSHVQYDKIDANLV